MARILVADDDEDVLKLIQRAFRGSDHDIVTVVDGHEALKLSLNRDFDLYILDVRMPRLDGYSLSLSISRKNPRGKILLITGLDSTKYEPMAQAARASAILPKPFTINQFLTQVETLLS
jgi:DNA-binding response OmpR family regulator